MQLRTDAVSRLRLQECILLAVSEVCSGDSTQWIGQSTGNSHELVVFLSDRILQDGSGNTVATFPASNGNPTPKGKVTTNPAARRIDHEWFVMLFDKQANEAHYDDPKILIGKRGPFSPLLPKRSFALARGC